MAKLTRVPAKVFAASAAADEIGQFGSAVAGSKLETADVATIQGLSAWLDGWSEALVSGNRYPALQEMNGLLKVLSYQGAYALQEGIPEYDSATTYYIGSIVKKTGTFELYGSLTDDNMGNALTVDTEWQLLINLADVGGGGVVDFENYGEVTTNLTLLENKISTAYFSSTNTLTLPTVTDQTKQVTCILDFTTATSGQPTITNANLKWSDKNRGVAPAAYSVLSGVRNVLAFKSIWINSVLYWEAEYGTYGGVETAFVQPILSANGTLGGGSFACASISIGAIQADSFEAFDNNASTNVIWYRTPSDATGAFIFYSPVPLNVTSLNLLYNVNYMGSGSIYGSNDGITYTYIATFSGNTSSNHIISLAGNTGFYKYTKCLGDTSNVTQGAAVIQCNITATYIAV